ncbi:MAG TPA: hypothetical protein VEW07_13080 [Solirubrobacterales bacterium]|nr:hypothetical protein [Solirubrobacterales bacterium]
MSPTVTAAQRDALYDQILDRLSGIGDIEVAIQARDFENAERIGREYSDELRLLLDDLGLGDGSGEPVELTAPPELLRRALPRLRSSALGHTAALEREAAEVGDLKDRNSLIAAACETVLGELDGTTGAR